MPLLTDPVGRPVARSVSCGGPHPHRQVVRIRPLALPGLLGAQRHRGGVRSGRVRDAGLQVHRHMVQREIRRVARAREEGCLTRIVRQGPAVLGDTVVQDVVRGPGRSGRGGGAGRGSVRGSARRARSPRASGRPAVRAGQLPDQRRGGQHDRAGREPEPSAADGTRRGVRTVVRRGGLRGSGHVLPFRGVARARQDLGARRLAYGDGAVALDQRAVVGSVASAESTAHRAINVAGSGRSAGSLATHSRISAASAGRTPARSMSSCTAR